MARKGKIVNITDPVYLLDKNRGFMRIPVYSPAGEYLEFQNLKFKNLEAWENNYFDIKINGKEYRIHRDDMYAALNYV